MALEGSPHTSRLLIPAALLITGAVFLVELAAPIGWALAALYVLPVALAAFWSSFRHSFLVVSITILSTVLATLAFFASPFWGSTLTMLTAYALPMAAVWFIAVLSLIRKAVERRHKHRIQRVICASCKQVCGEQGRWPIDQYAQQHLGTFVSLGLCSECAGRWGAAYPGRMNAGA